MSLWQAGHSSVLSSSDPHAMLDHKLLLHNAFCTSCGSYMATAEMPSTATAQFGIYANGWLGVGSALRKELLVGLR